jgi:acetyl esterase
MTPEVRVLVDLFERQGAKPYDQMGVVRAREVTLASAANLQRDRLAVDRVDDLVVPGPAGRLPVRVYHPRRGQRLPLLVYLHGGGWVTGGISVVDRPCRRLAEAAGCVVAAVEYRLSPETQYPGPLEDVYAATCWLAAQREDLGVRPDRLVLAGDSAGGNLVAATTLLARDRRGPQITDQVLLYPALLAPGDDSPFASYIDNGDDVVLSRSSMEWFWGQYLVRPSDGVSPYASPLRATDLQGLPRALVVTTGLDVLRDEGQAYAKRLLGAGVDTTAVHYEGVVHGFLWMDRYVPEATAVLAEIAEYLQRGMEAS